MTTNKPEIRAFLMQQDGYEPYVSIGRDSNCSGVTHPLIRLSEYEVLAAECEKLRNLLRQTKPVMQAHAGASHLLEGFRPKRNQWDQLVEAIDSAIQEASQ